MDHQQKRRMTRSEDLEIKPQKLQKPISASPDRRYTIAWICALPKEMVAAHAMLDDVHEALPRYANDINTYAFGSIRRHNVVIACLPMGQYGMNNAVTVLTHLVRTFTSIRLCLMVGIGGGMPREGFDIRLGDVVVGTKVVQHDLGKIVGNGQIMRTADPRTLNPLIGTAVSFLQAKHVLDSSQIPLIVEERFKRYAQYNRPTTEDRLFISIYQHNTQASNCDDCSPSAIVQRCKRSTNGPFIHYGTIASGNQVIKDSIQRDSIAKQLNAICFDMEAAGLIDICPCLSIRGICDYSDSHKNDEWQEYAAATAAACARELLEQLPPAEDSFASTGDPGFQDEKHKKCLQDLRAIDPRDDKTRIQDTKGGLLADACRWIFDNEEFRQWHDGSESQLLWIKGDPGKGKTMLLCGIIDRLEKERSGSLSYFFCQATEAQLSNATAVLRGLIFLLVIQQPSLIVHIEEKYTHAGKQLFEDINAWQALSKIFTAMLEDSRLDGALLIIDAIDECTTNRGQLLDLIIRSTNVKWIVTSRNLLEIEQKLDHATQKVRLQLELNQESVSKAVEAYIEHKVNHLANEKSYDGKLKNEVKQHLVEHADGTFLWVALVCQELADDTVTRKCHTLSKLKSFPQGLDPLYERMMEYLSQSNDASVCKEILALSSVIYRPITLDELKVLVESLEEDDYDDLPQIIGSCGSFLTIREDIVYFVHQSAKDFLLSKAPRVILPSGTAHQHQAIFKRSVKTLSEALKRDICGLNAPGYSIDEVSPLLLKPLSNVRYSCIYWVDHLYESDHTRLKDELRDGGDVHMFIQMKFLYWLESLSLLRRLGEGVKVISKLLDLVTKIEAAEQLEKLLRDARRFVLTFVRPIEIAPLQVYASALVFSPERSLIRDIFKSEEPDWIALKPAMEKNWNNCLQTLDGHSEPVESVAFSADDKFIASGSADETVRIWDIETGLCRQILKGHSYVVRSVAFFPDTQCLTSVSVDRTVKTWNTETGSCLRTLDFHDEKEVVLSPDGKRLALLSRFRAIRIWDIEKDACLQTLENCGDTGAFSPDGQRLAWVSTDNTIRIWDIQTGICLRELESDDGIANSMVLSFGGERLASVSSKGTVNIRHTATGFSLPILNSHIFIPPMAFSKDGQCLALGFSGVKIFNTETGKVLQVVTEFHKIYSVAFTANRHQLATGSVDGTVKIWETSIEEPLPTVRDQNGVVGSIVISPDSHQLATGSVDGTVKIWETSIEEPLPTIRDQNGVVSSIVISPDNHHLASDSDNAVKIWDMATGVCQHTLLGHLDAIQCLVFSSDSKRLASSSIEAVRIWDVITGISLQALSQDFTVSKVTFSADSQYLASAADRTVKIWDIQRGQCLNILEHDTFMVSLGFSADGKLLATGSIDGIIMIWGTEDGLCLRRIETGDFMTKVAVSVDNQYLASAMDDEKVKIWDLAEGKCLQILDVGVRLRYLSFDSRTKCQLYTDIGILSLELPNLTPNVNAQSIVMATSPCFDRFGYRIGGDRAWVMKHGKALLWIPPEYRSEASDVFGSTLALGSSSGRVLIMTFR